ncbi:BTB/POZ domain-containing protein [Orchesella cincta]|uniref:BTB/POZ domain-containing protein n=1 Tax=Orchesella cincta TaxID=48709 RepID=A0A1D2MAX6_ORCCI|nr:BTB/POZ domain-containing protein [Orchesella cincta]
MQFVIVQNPEPGVVVPVHQAVNGERSWNIVLEAKLLPTITTWEPNQLKQLAIRFHGRLLEEMSGLCGEDVQFTFEGTLTRHGEGVTITIPFTTEALPSVHIPLLISRRSVADRKCKLNVLKSVMRTDVSSDISILGDGGFKISAHSFFLIAQSSVLKELLQQCMFGRLKLKDVSEKCIRALLEYLYTFQISLAVKSSKVTVELFIAANKYEIQPLQDKLAKMILERRNAWFDITATLDLFLFIRKLGRTNILDEVKGKIGQVLKSKGKVLIMESEGYQKLVVDDVNAAMEMCTAMANAD